MDNDCPAHAELEAFAAGDLAPEEREAVEAHLARCLACSEALEGLTRAQLDLLVGLRGPTTSLPPEISPVLDTVMRRATESGGAWPRPDPERLLAMLDAPSAEGALGTFAGYDILEIAGSGGTGVVLKARDRTLDRIVALKVVFPTGAGLDAFGERFLEEARSVAAIDHDHVVTVHQAGMAKGLPYLVMPFYAQGTLDRQMTEKRKFPPMDVARVGWQLARALQATHARGILHRDLKPSNVLLEDGLERVRLADFGLAQAGVVNPSQAADKAADSSATGSRVSGTAAVDSGPRTVAGTPHYMSPEQARGEAIDARSDLFGLGAVLFQMATGRTLYAGKSSKEVLLAATRCELKPVREMSPEVPAALAVIIDRLLARRAEDRFATAAEVAAGLEQFIHSEHWLRLWLKRVAVTALGAGVALSALVLALDGSGRTAFINTLLHRRTGDAYSIRGRFGTYARLPEALAAARAHEVIDVRFSGERLTDPFGVGGRPLTLRAAAGFTPVFVATNNGQPMILADAPLTLEGLTLWRRGPQPNFIPLISVENAPLHMLNCRIIRSRFQGQNVLVWGRARMTPANDSQIYHVLLAFQHGSSGHLQNCLVAGVQAAAIGLRASTNQPARVATENSLFAINRAVFLRPEGHTRVELRFARSMFVTDALLDLDDTGPMNGISVALEDCVVDRARGALVRVNQIPDSGLFRALDWTETNVVYAGRGSFVVNRSRLALNIEAQWNDWMRLTSNSHRLVDLPVFPETLVRSSLRLTATDADLAGLHSRREGRREIDPMFIGEGRPFDRYRRTTDYRVWQEQTRATIHEWEQRRAAKGQTDHR